MSLQVSYCQNVKTFPLWSNCSYVNVQYEETPINFGLIMIKRGTLICENELKKEDFENQVGRKYWD